MAAVDVAVSVVGPSGGESVIGRDCGAEARGSMKTVRVEVEVGQGVGGDVVDGVGRGGQVSRTMSETSAPLRKVWMPRFLSCSGAVMIAPRSL